MQKTKSTKESEIQRFWHVYDLNGKILGRVASEIAVALRGKGKHNYVPYLDCGDYVVAVNASKIKVTGGKEEKKIYTRFSGYPGGLKKEKYKDIFAVKPEKIIRKAVFGMLPNNKLKDKIIKRLYIYKEAEHPYKEKFKVKN